MPIDVYCVTSGPVDVTTGAGLDVSLGDGGLMGPPGPPGLDGSSSLVRTPSTILSGQRVVCAVGDTDARYPDSSAVLDAELILGVTTGASGAGATAMIQGSGEMQEPSWTWSPGPVFCGPAGQLIQSPPPGAAWLRQVGVAVAPDRLLIQLRPPILL